MVSITSEHSIPVIRIFCIQLDNFGYFSYFLLILAAWRQLKILLKSYWISYLVFLDYWTSFNTYYISYFKIFGSRPTPLYILARWFLKNYILECLDLSIQRKKQNHSESLHRNNIIKDSECVLEIEEKNYAFHNRANYSSLTASTI